tara:strand:+ start:2655 stop:2966 length:312 start_codon:yes stop_codon:yes gene_type:complete
MQLHNQNEAGGIELSSLQVPTKGNAVYGGTQRLFSSIKDYLTFCQMILNKGTWNGSQVLSKETIATMTDNHVKDFWVLLGGLDWALESFEIQKLIQVQEILDS